MKNSAGPKSLLALVFLICLLLPGRSDARPEFARFTGNPCSACHLSSQGGGPLKPEGEMFREKLKDLDIPMDPSLRVTTGQRLTHLLLYFIHIPFGVSWVGLFLYIFAPALRTGAPATLLKVYTRQILYGAAVVLVTGPLMVFSRMKMVPGVFGSRFGFLLLVKIIAVAALLTATVALLWHATVSRNRRYKRLLRSLDKGSDLELTPHDLSLFSGQEKRKALVAVDGLIYDVTGRNLWRRGIHPGGHHAGRNLTDAFNGAPHGREVLERVVPVGRFVEPETDGKNKPLSWAVLLGVVASVVILLAVALWRW